MQLARNFLYALIALAILPVHAKDVPTKEVKLAFEKMLDRPKVEPSAEVRSTKQDENFITENITFASERHGDGTYERVPMLLIKPKAPTGKLPAVIVLHGTGGNKESQAGLMRDLAKRGIIGVAIDGRYHGERSGGAGTKAYLEAITQAWRTKPGDPQAHPFYYDTVWDLWRTVDYLQSRPDIDGERLGMIGFSKGGIETWLAASVDDRIKVAIPAISVQSFAWSLANNQWQGRAKTIGATHEEAAKDMGEPAVNAAVCEKLWNKVIPGMLDQFDCPSVLRLFAGRPLLILNGELDPNCPIGGVEVAFASAKQAYEAAGCPEKLKIDIAKGGGHAVTDSQRKLAIEWLVTSLKPTP